MGFGDENVLDFAQVALCAGANDTTSDKRFDFMVSQFHVNRVKILKGYMNINPVSSQIFSRSKIGLVPCVSSLTFQFLVNNSTYIQQNKQDKLNVVTFERMYAIHLFFFGDVFTAVVVVELSDITL